MGVDYDAIRCPVYVIGGLADPYGNQIPRLLASLKVPRKGLYGPWRHGYPAPASPGPGLDWAWEEVRWWRHWLLGEATGIMSEPMLRAYLPDAVASQVSPGPIPGRWIAEPSWPAPNIADQALYLGAGGLHDNPQPAETLRLGGGRIVGLSAVEWVPFAPTEMPREQSSDDARSAVFDTPPLAAATEILGAPVLRVRVTADRPVTHLAVRLCEVRTGGQSWLVTHGLLNLTHRDGHEHPVPLVPGHAYDVAIPLNFTAHRFQAGSRIRAALSQSLWPLVWPAPEVATLSVALAESRLDLPVRTPPAHEAPTPIEPAPAASSDPAGWPTMEINEAKGEARVVETWPMSNSEVADIGMNVSSAGPNIALWMTAGDPQSCAWSAEQSSRYQRAGWDVSITAEVSIRSTATDFLVNERTLATYNGEVVADKTHATTITRHLG